MNAIAEADPSAEEQIVIPPRKTFPERMKIVASAILTEWKDKDLDKLRKAQRVALNAFMNYCAKESDGPYKDEAEADLAEGVSIFRTALESLANM